MSSDIQQDFNVEQLRAQFPALHQQVNGKPLVYLDNAATAQKPQVVIDTLQTYYRQYNANVHRGAHFLSDKATREFEQARLVVQAYLNAAHSEEIIWTKGTTEALNLIAHSYARQFLSEGDEILISALEHHANIVPWQISCQMTGANLKIIPVTPQGELDMEAFAQQLSDKTRLVSVAHVSNALGTVNPVAEIVKMAHQRGALVCIDGAQAVPHGPLDVQSLDCDFYAFSGHKLYGPTGIGALYGKLDLLESMVPYQSGGEMIEKVSFQGTTYQQPPFKFEAGTPNIAGAIGLAAAIKFVQSLPLAKVREHEQQLMAYATEKAAEFADLQLVGTAADKIGAFSFLLKGTHPNDVGTLLDQQGIAVRTGHHCAMPIMEQLQIPGTVRASFGFYNTKAEIDKLFSGLTIAKELLL